jgi:hypothetical protein
MTYSPNPKLIKQIFCCKYLYIFAYINLLKYQDKKLNINELYETLVNLRREFVTGH